jgi:hypothetical protein
LDEDVANRSPFVTVSFWRLPAVISGWEANIKNPCAFGTSVFESIHSLRQAWLVDEFKNPSAKLKGF